MQRPISLTLIAVINICYGILSVCGLSFSVAQMLALQYGLVDFGVELPKEAYETTLFEKIRSAFGFTINFSLSILLTVSGGGLLAAKPWARIGTIVYAVITPIYLVFTAIMTFVFVSSQREQMQELTGGAMTPDQLDMGFRMMFFMMTLMALINITHCGITYIILKRPTVEEWFNAANWKGEN